MNEADVHVKEKFKQNKRIRSIPFLSTENFPKWIPAFLFDDVAIIKGMSCAFN